MQSLLKHFSHYFNDIDFTKFAWIQNPFLNNQLDAFELTIFEKEQLIEISCDTSLQQEFDSKTLIQFWVERKKDYITLSDRAIIVLLPFVTSYLCETGFSALAAMKSKY